MSDQIHANLNETFAQFKQAHGIHHVIAFSGGADTRLSGVSDNDPLQDRYASFVGLREQQLVSQALDILRHYRIAVLSGGTRFGVPKTALEVANDHGIKTIGVFPQSAREKGYVVDQIDLPICIEPNFGASRWGDEASVFAKLLDAVIVLAGGAGTLIEMAHILKMNESLLGRQIPVKLIVPLHGTGGVADGLPFVWGKQDIKNACMPASPIFTGAQAAKFIEEKIDLWNH